MSQIYLPKELEGLREEMKPGFQSPMEIYNKYEEDFILQEDTLSGAEFFTPVTEVGFQHYYVSQKGRIWNSQDGLLMKLTPQKSGVQTAHLIHENGSSHTFLVHRVVANAFLDNKEKKPYVTHIDKRKKSKNDVSNLKWATPKENNKSTLEDKLIALGKRTPEEENEEILKLRRENPEWSSKKISEVLNININTVRTKCREAGLPFVHKHKIPQETIEKMFELRREGYSYSKISRILDVHHETVRDKCRAAGVEKPIKA